MHRRSLFLGGRFLLLTITLITLFSLLVTSAAALKAPPAAAQTAQSAAQLPSSPAPAVQTADPASVDEHTLLEDALALKSSPQDQAEQQKQALRLQAVNQTHRDLQIADVKIEAGRVQQQARLTALAKANTTDRMQKTAGLFNQSAQASHFTQSDLQKPFANPGQLYKTKPAEIHPSAHQAEGGMQQQTLQPLHRNTSNGHYSGFQVTNTDVSTGNFTVEFYWPNDVMAGTYGPVAIPPAQVYNFYLGSMGFLPGTFVGRAVITGDQAFTAQIVTPAYGIIQGHVYQNDGVTPQGGVGVGATSWPDLQTNFGGMGTFSDGSYYIGGLSDGSYSTNAYAGYPWLSQWYNGKNVDPSHADEIKITGANTASNIDFVLQPGGRIEGTVYAADGVTPLDNVNVSLEDGGFGACTNMSGQFVMEVIPYGSHKVVAGRGWNWCTNANSLYLPEYYHEAPDVNQATPVTINAGADTATGIDFTLDPGGMIKGQVTQSGTGTLLAAINVTVVDFYGGGTKAGAQTDSSGNYSIGGLPDGTYMVFAEDNNNDGILFAKQFYAYASFQQSAEPVTISGQNTRDNINFNLNYGGTITGRAVDSKTGLPLANINVDLNEGYFGTCTDSNGYYTLSGVPYGGRIVVAGTSWNWCTNSSSAYIQEYYHETYNYNQATLIDVSGSNPNPTGIDFTMETGGSIKGRVTAAASGQPLANIHIDVVDFYNGNNKSGVETDADGYYTVSGLLDGSYMVAAHDYNNDGVMYAAEFYPEATYQQGAQPVVVSSSGAVDKIDFTLDPGGAISGHIVDSKTGNPLGYINVDLEQGWFGACTDSNGYYYIPSVPFGGQYIVAARDWNWCTNTPNGYVSEYYDNAYSLDQATPVQLSSGTPSRTDIDFSLDTGAAIEGHVTSAATGNPIAGIRVNANEYDQGKFGRGTNTDANGYFVIGGLPPGDYRLSARDEDMADPSYANQYYNHTPFYDVAQRITINGTETLTGYDFTLDLGGDISGRLYDKATGNPAPYVCVSANRNTDGLGEGACTDSQGYFTITGLPYGDFQVNAGGNKNWNGQPLIYAQKFYIDTPYRWEAALVSISASRPHPSGVDIHLEKGGFISGHVHDEGGNPLANIRMVAQVQQPWCMDCTEWMEDGYTDANGNYTIGPLASLDYAVYACPSCTGNVDYYSKYYQDSLSFSSANKVTVTSENTSNGIDITLNHGVQLHGTVTVLPGYSPGNVWIDVWRNDGPWYNSGTQANPDGSYLIALPQLDDNNWAVRANPKGTDLGGQRAEKINIVKQDTWDFNLIKGGSMSGVITVNGIPTGGVNVNTWSIWYGDGTQTASDGSFMITNLPAGSYELTGGDKNTSTAWQNYHGKAWNSYQRIELATAENKTGFNIDLAPVGRIEGHVFDSDGVTPVTNVRITALQGDNYYDAWPQPDGYFTIDLPSRDTVLMFTPDDWTQFQRTYYPGVARYTSATVLHVQSVAAGSTIVAQNLPRRGRIHGTVTDSSTGLPQGGILVSAILNDPAVDMAYGNSTCTDENGNYKLDGIAAGPTKITTAGICGNTNYSKQTFVTNMSPGGDMTLNIPITANPQVRRFTIYTPDTWDYTPLPLNAVDISTPNNHAIVPALFAPMVGLNDQNQWYSDLLTRVPTPENGDAVILNNQLSVTYHLKPGLLWSDGTPTTSADLRFTWQMLTHTNPYNDPYNAMIHPLWRIVAIDTPDPLTAVVHFQPGAIPNGYLEAIQYLLPEHSLAGKYYIDTGFYSTFAHIPVGNGPYVVEDWAPGGYLDLRANPNYVRRGEGLPKIESLRLQFTGDPYEQLRRGLIDVVANGDSSWDLSGMGASLHQTNNQLTGSLIPNDRLPFFQDVAVRKALSQAIDRQGFVDKFGKVFSVANDYLSPTHPLRGGTLTTYPYNPAEASSQLDAAGWSDHDADGIRDKNGVKLSFDLDFINNNGVWFTLAQQVQTNLAAIGVETHLVGWDRSEYTDRLRRGELDCAMLGWWFDMMFDPFGYEMFHSRLIPTGYNRYETSFFTGMWSDPTNDSLLEGTLGEISRTTLAGLYTQQQTHWTDQTPIWPVFYGNSNSITRDTLVGLKIGGASPVTWNIQEWYLPPNPYDLSIRKTLSENSPSARPGAALEYSLQVTNLGYFAATGAVVLDSLPANLTFVSATPPPSSIDGKTLRWDMGDLQPNQVKTINLHAQVSASAHHGDTVQNNAQVSMNEPDSHPENNGVIHTVTVREDVDLKVEKYGVGQSAIGEQYQYYINYSNQGGAPASNLTVTDTLPPQVNYQSADPAPDNINGRTLTWNLSSLAGGQWGSQIKVNTEIDQSGTVTNNADVSSPDSDANPSNNHASATQNVAAILPPVITRPTSGVTDGSPTVSGTAPSSATVRVYNIVPATPVLLGTTTADGNGRFSLPLSLAEGGYTLAATAEKSTMLSPYSNNVAITVDQHLPLDPDQVTITADSVDLSAGCVQAERRVLPYRTMQVSAVILCPELPDAHLRVVENGQFTFNSAPLSVTPLSGGAWQLDFQVWLGEAHSNYQVFLEWDCQGTQHSVLLLYILVDPDGFVYDKAMVDAGTPMENALVTDGSVTIYEKSGDDWIVWPATLYGQYNPQATDGATNDGVLTPGYYSFLTPSGQYRIEAEAPGYLPYQSDVLTVITTPVRVDIPLIPITAGSEISLAPANLSSSTLEASPDPVYAGGVLTYDLYLRNTGQVDTDSLTLDDPIPAMTSYVPGSLKFEGPGTAGYNSTLNKITWSGFLPSDGTVHLHFQVRVMSGPGNTDPIENIASLSGSTANLLSAPQLKVKTIVDRRDTWLPLVQH